MARLLLVDDDPAQLRIWLLLMEAWGHNIETAETVECGIEKLSTLELDVLIMDLRLPELEDGLRLIRYAGRYDRLKVIVLSGWPLDLESSPEHRLVDRILAKPVRPNTLLSTIGELVSRTAAG